MAKAKTDCGGNKIFTVKKPKTTSKAKKSTAKKK